MNYTLTEDVPGVGGKGDKVNENLRPFEAFILKKLNLLRLTEEGKGLSASCPYKDCPRVRYNECLVHSLIN